MIRFAEDSGHNSGELKPNQLLALTCSGRLRYRCSSLKGFRLPGRRPKIQGEGQDDVAWAWQLLSSSGEFASVLVGG
jgi:hypothetical protein